MKKIIIFLQIIFIVSVLNLHAQVILSTNGSYDTFQGGSISWTMGEPITETIGNSNNELTQGFHQTDLYSEHVIAIPEGWSYISSFLSPIDPDIENLMQEIITESNLVIMMSTGGILAPPPFSIKTLGSWDSYLGYKVKMDSQDELYIKGDLTINSIDFPAGQYLIPVLTNVVTPITEVFADPENDIHYLLDIYTNEVYWPNGGIFTLSDLLPGKGYLANFKNPVTLTFPDYNNLSKSSIANINAPLDEPWGLTRTSDFHLISIDESAIRELDDIDYIGAFNSEGMCVGYSYLDHSGYNALLTVFGDDMLTSQIDGAIEGEQISFKGFSTSTQEEKMFQPEFSTGFTNHDGLFTLFGISGITTFRNLSSETGKNDLANQVSVYPNPADNYVMISYPSLEEAANVRLITIDGQLIMSSQLNGDMVKLNVTGVKPGMYILQFETRDQRANKRLVIQ